MPNLKRKLRNFCGAPPDAGWSWVVLIGAFLNLACLDGLVYSFGVYLPSIMDHYQSNKGTTSWANSVLSGFLGFIGPLAAILTKKIGCRAVSTIGGVILAAGMLLSTFSPTVNVFVFVYGVVGGLGIGLLYLPCILMIGVYFNKRRAMAVGIASCGSGFGVFVFAPMADALLTKYHWRGALWVTSGIILNCAVFSSVFRPFKQARSNEKCTETDYIHDLKSGAQESNVALLISTERDSKELVNLSRSFLFIDSSFVETINSSENVGEASTSLENLNISTERHDNDYFCAPDAGRKQHPTEESEDIDETFSGNHSLLLHSHNSLIGDAIQTKEQTMDEGSLQRPPQDEIFSISQRIHKRLASCILGYCDKRVLKNPANVLFGAICSLYALGKYIYYNITVNKEDTRYTTFSGLFSLLLIILKMLGHD